MRAKGKIATWNDQKGFGFIDPLGGGKRVFIHIKAFSNRNRRPEIGQVVTYALSSDNQGRPCASRATLAGDLLSPQKKRSSGTISIIIAAISLFVVGIVVMATKLPPLILLIYLGASLITFIVYAMDKSAAQKGAWRTQESTLHLLSVIGGWPGAMAAQGSLRHKSRKQSFRVVYWMTVAINCGVFLWLLTPLGNRILTFLISATT